MRPTLLTEYCSERPEKHDFLDGVEFFSEAALVLAQLVPAPGSFPPSYAATLAQRERVGKSQGPGNQLTVNLHNPRDYRRTRRIIKAG
jgi:hypothetical protein